MGIAERREREKLQRRNSIIEAAEYVFMTKGFEQSTMDDIAHKSELSKGTLYLYFQSKIELCLSIVLKGLTIILQKFQKVQAENLTGIEQIQVFIEVFLDFSEKYPNYIFAFSNYQHHKTSCKHKSVIMEKIDIHNTSINDLIKTMIRKGIADNSIKADVEEEKLVKAFWGQLDGLIPLFSFNNSDESKDVFSYVIFLIRTAIKKI